AGREDLPPNPGGDCAGVFHGPRLTGGRGLALPRRAYLPSEGRLTNRPACSQTSRKWARSWRLSSRRVWERSIRCRDCPMSLFARAAGWGRGRDRARMPSPRVTGRRGPHLEPSRVAGDSEGGKSAGPAVGASRPAEARVPVAGRRGASAERDATAAVAPNAPDERPLRVYPESRSKSSKDLRR